jgi:hypothetical protein
MTTADRILNAIGSAASGALIAAESGQLPLPWWAKMALAIIVPAAFGTAAPMVKRSSLTPGKKDARGQVRDDEDPR